MRSSSFIKTRLKPRKLKRQTVNGLRGGGGCMIYDTKLVTRLPKFMNLEGEQSDVRWNLRTETYTTKKYLTKGKLQSRNCLCSKQNFKNKRMGMERGEGGQRLNKMTRAFSPPFILKTGGELWVWEGGKAEPVTTI